MTAIGKLLTFLILVLSLAWAGLTVNGFVTRNNWKADADHYKDEARKATEAAAKIKTQLDAQREAMTADKLALEAENERLSKLLTGRETHLNGVVTAYTGSFGIYSDLLSKVDVIQTNEKKLQQQVDNQAGQMAALETQLDDQTKKANAEKIRADKNYLDSQAQGLRANTLEGRLQALNDVVAELQRDRRAGGSGGLQPGGGKAVAAPPEFHGTVTARDVEGSTVWVSFTPGLDAGLQKGARLTVRRLGANPKYLGKVVVNLANPKSSVGTFIPPPGSKLTPDDLPRAGDELVPE